MESLVRALSELYLITARAGEESQDRKAVVTLYARKLREFPGDVALAAVQNYRGKFFPTFEELRAAIEQDSRTAERLKRRRAFIAFLNGDDEPISPENRPKEAQIARNAQLASELKGERSAQKWTPEQIEGFARVDGTGKG